MRIPVEARRAYRLLNHGPTTLITSSHGGRRNVMAAAWVMPLDFEPPKIAAVIAQDTYTRELVDASSSFVVSVPPSAMLEQLVAAGSRTGRGIDKLAELGLSTSPASRVEAPLVDGCVAWLECVVVREPGVEQRYDLFVAEVVAAWADDEVFREGRWQFADDARRTVHHVAGGAFFVTGAEVKVGG